MGVSGGGATRGVSGGGATLVVSGGGATVDSAGGVVTVTGSDGGACTAVVVAVTWAVGGTVDTVVRETVDGSVVGVCDEPVGVGDGVVEVGVGTVVVVDGNDVVSDGNDVVGSLVVARSGIDGVVVVVATTTGTCKNVSGEDGFTGGGTPGGGGVASGSR